MKIKHLIVWIVWYLESVCCNTSLKQTRSITSNNNSNFLYTFKFRLSLDCWPYRKVAGLSYANKTANTPNECQRILEKSQYEVLYWDYSTKCMSISYKVINACPLIDADMDSLMKKTTLIFSISNETPINIRQMLTKKGYKQEIQNLMGCSGFFCDDFTCIESGLKCDGVSHCPDQSDENSCSAEGESYCLGHDGKFSKIGEEYVPPLKANECRVCECGYGGKPSYCYSPQCSFQLSCAESDNICCKCYGSDKAIGADPEQRLLATCLSLLLIVAFMFVLSRAISHRFARPSSPSLPAWPPIDANTGLPPNRSFFATNPPIPPNLLFSDEIFSSNRDVVSPPAYKGRKPAEENDANEQPPPSYEDCTKGQDKFCGYSTEEAALKPRSDDHSNVDTNQEQLNTPDSVCSLLPGATDSNHH